MKIPCSYSVIFMLNLVQNVERECEHLIVMKLFAQPQIYKTINPSEFLPNHYKGDMRKDRVLGGGGVMIAMKSNIIAEEVEININAEIVWFIL